MATILAINSAVVYTRQKTKKNKTKKKQKKNDATIKTLQAESQKKKKKTVSFPKISRKAIQNKNKNHQTIHTMTEIVNHSRSTTLERSVKNLLRVGLGQELKSILLATTLALSSAVVYIRYLFSPREWFLHCNSSVQHLREHKIKLIQI